MDMATIEGERPKARQAFLDYRRAVRARHDAEDAQIMRGYRELAAGRQLILLRDSVLAGGTTLKRYRQTVDGAWRTNVLPRIAVCRAHALICFTNGVQEDGSVQFRSKEEVAARNTFDRVRLRTLFPPVEGLDVSPESDWRPRWRAIVPLVPPALRPKAGLRNFHVLFEADWEVRQPPAPRDPALLRHIGGDLYAVVAVWELTELERAVLAGRV